MRIITIIIVSIIKKKLMKISKTQYLHFYFNLASF